ncbi:MAG TPA: nucleotidyltransferase family protein [Gaiellaceae bacterium]|jgi:glucose-1-phosphate thymidylyltransferase|nr:nucleotidyltransferase family protein [Gaiellaceae bacterium]
MNALILAAGYATRLRPLTDALPKQLLPVGARPMLDWIADKLEEIPGLGAIHLVTNARYAPDLSAWAERRGGIVVHDDGTTSNEDRLGAIGDVRLVLDRTRLADDDLFVIAGDNLFDASLAEYVTWWRGKRVASAVGLYDVRDPSLARHYGLVELAEDQRIIGFVEKPPDPKSTLVATATYALHREHVVLIEPYLSEGNPSDQPGNFLAWLHSRRPVYGYLLPGDWYDIGTPDQLLQADNRFRARAGLPTRSEYALD